MESEDTSGNFIPFVKRSQMVSRCNARAGNMDVTFLTSQCEFWDRLSQQPSMHWMEEYNEASPSLMSSHVVHRPDDQLSTVSLQVLSASERLPSPKELCGKKRSRQKRRYLQNGSVTAAFNHLEELKRRQRNIDQLKRLHWGGYTQSSSEGFEEGVISRVASEVVEDASHHGFLTRLLQPNTAALYYGDGDFFRSTPAQSDRQLFYPQWGFGTEEQLPIPAEQPMIYMMASVDRDNLSLPACLSPQSFWGFQHQPEE
ncbi:protein INCA1 isoform X2 [Rhinatrema bivittatum]|uniref:protein INCA1 isoform X2 n=1 Tax=Rhinatrema bivittatum TaxID=194408 RepID=UPI001125E9F4|nr:protein INCA1 isoform X2 [Rhinatrema bivittatum]